MFCWVFNTSYQSAYCPIYWQTLYLLPLPWSLSCGFLGPSIHLCECAAFMVVNRRYATQSKIFTPWQRKNAAQSTSALGIRLCVLLARFSISTWSFWFMNKGKAAINVIKVKYWLLIGSLLLPQQFQGSLLDEKLNRLNHEESVQIFHFHNSHIMTE